jgi:hypothetical protein
LSLEIVYIINFLRSGLQVFLKSQGKNRSLQYKTEENENRKQNSRKTESKIVEKQKAK